MMGTISSMTGIGVVSAQLSPRLAARVRVWSCNSKGLDVSIRIAPKGDFPELELAVRKLVAERLHRGKVTASLDLRMLSAEGRFRLNWEVAHSFITQLAQAGPEVALEPLTLRDLLGLPGFCELSEGEPDDDEEHALLQLVDQALAELVASRRQEGLLLLPAISRELAQLGDFVGWLRKQGQDLPTMLFNRLKERIRELLEQELDEQRLWQEVAFLAQRADVTEEQTRLEAHLQHFEHILQEGGSVGRKLDFLVQEMLREVNTAGSKLREVGMGEKVVAAKAALERLREQVANLE